MPTILATKETTMTVDLLDVPEIPTIVVRTYELFDVRWARGSRWTGYWTREEAQAALDHSSDRGVIERRTWEASWDLRDERDARLLDIASPGIAERIEVAR